MPTITLNSAEWTTCSMTFGQAVAYNCEPVQSLLRSVEAMHQTVPVSKVEVTTSPSPTEYLIVLEDGRKWRQKFLDATADPPMTFLHADAWKESEFALQRAVRDAIVDLIATCELTALLVKPA